MLGGYQYYHNKDNCSIRQDKHSAWFNNRPLTNIWIENIMCEIQQNICNWLLIAQRGRSSIQYNY